MVRRAEQVMFAIARSSNTIGVHQAPGELGEGVPPAVGAPAVLATHSRAARSLIRVAATTLSRCTSRPAALSACCFTPTSCPLVQPHAPALPLGEDHGGSGIWGSRS